MIDHPDAHRKTKVHVTLRVPPSLARSIDEYATDHNLSKTDAYTNLVQLGLDAASEDGPSPIEEKLDEILSLLKPA